MSGLASLLLALGHRVTGSDRVTSEEVERLCKLGLKFSMSHSASDAAEADLVVYSSAIHAGNATFDEAKRLEKKMARRAEVLAALMMRKKGILVCGMHGKTTTSSLLAHVLNEGGLHPSHYVGAEIPILGTNARWNTQGDYFVAEGDESDGTLVNYLPEQAIVLNIEPEHLDFYKNLEAIDAVYSRLVTQTKGPVFYWLDDPGAARVCADHPKAIPVGKSEGALYRYESLKQERYASSFEVIAKNKVIGSVKLNIPGVHNVHNALLVIALALELGVPFEFIQVALKKFCGAKRRFELKYEGEEFLLFDDYGHHPTEIAATLATARTLLEERGLAGRLVVLFQPHRYSRTAAFCQEFGKVLLNADLVFVTDIYPASEEPLPGVTGASIVQAAESQGHLAIFYYPLVEGLRKRVAPLLKAGDIILSLGAGNIHEEGTRLVTDFKKREELLSVMGPGSIALYEPLSRHTTLRVGGLAQFWVEPETEEGFARLVKYCTEEKIPLMVIGRGSNLLVRDGGFSGVVVHLARGCFANCSVKGTHIYAGVGVKLKQLSGVARQAELGGFEWMEGIPGNVGGSLRMNAGAMGQETMAQVTMIRYVTTQGEIKEWLPPFADIHYRDVSFFKNNYALAATFQGYPEKLNKIEAALEQSWKHRRETQPIAASAGCIFKNPRKISAGRLIEELGLKNHTVGKARVSEIHGNFIVNDGGATAREVLQVIEDVKRVALQERGIVLETEVQIVGE
ncbi:MAG: UDP-N-acetylmuramate--L-alanine ligase [Chthoniobacterales bacterium]|nr:UDP-N-acetylmuramate--L-alanine ligase [Chthoniobacterales bacterium]